MSIYHVCTIKTMTIDGVKYNGIIDKTVNIDFSATTYTVKILEDASYAEGVEIELIPDNMDFLHEMTELFPLSEYEYKIIQSVYSHLTPHVSLHVDITNRETGVNVYFAESAILSDKDYDYIRDILLKEASQCEWQTADRYIHDSIESFMSDINIEDLFTDKAWEYLSSMVSARYKEFKTDGYVDFVDGNMIDVTKEILEDVLRNACEPAGAKNGDK